MATLFVGVTATILCIQSTLIAVVTFTAVLLIVLYALIALSALVSRMRQANLPARIACRSGRVPPLIALIGTVVAITQQKVVDLVIVGVIIVAGLLYYYLYLEPRKDRYWNITTDPNRELQNLAGRGD